MGSGNGNLLPGVVWLLSDLNLVVGPFQENLEQQKSECKLGFLAAAYGRIGSFIGF